MSTHRHPEDVSQSAHSDREHDRFDRVPNAKEGRESVDFEIYGVNGIPEEAYAERAAKKARITDASPEEAPFPKSQEIPAADISAPAQPSAVPGQGMHSFAGQQQMPGMMFGGPPMPGMGFHPMGQQGFPGMMGGPRPGFNPMQHGMPPMQHGGPHMAPHMFGGPRGPNGQMLGGPGGPVHPGYPPRPGAPPGALPPPGLPPGHRLPPGPPSSNGTPSNGVPSGLHGNPGAARGPVPPLFPAGAGVPQPRELCVESTAV